MWTLGKTAALAATARLATRQQERTRRLGERIDLAREIHERVMQRLFGVSLVLSAQTPLTDEQRERCRTEMVEALADLRSALERPLAPVAMETGTTLRAEIARLARESGLPVELAWPEGVEVPPRLEGVAQSVLAEALRNARQARRADARGGAGRGATRTRSRWRSATTASTPRRARRRGGSGMGLRLAAFEALAARRLRRVRRRQGVAAARLARAARRAGGEDGSAAAPPSRGRGPGGRGVNEERRLRVLVVDDHDVVHWGFRQLLGEQSWVERCLAARNADEALELTTPLPPARRARRPVPRQRVGRRHLRVDPRDVARDARAADLRRGAHLAAGGEGRRRVRASSRRTGARTTSRWRCGWSGSG